MNCPNFDKRVSRYLNEVMTKPGLFCFVPKKKGLSSAKAIHNERMAVVDQIEFCLKLADIKYDRVQYKIRVRHGLP